MAPHIHVQFDYGPYIKAKYTEVYNEKSRNS